MAGDTRALAAALAAAFVVSAAPAPAAAQQRPDERWYRPVIEDAKAFPVLLSAARRWLNWTDTYGAPRMRLVGGRWKQTGVHRGIDIYAEQGAPVVAGSGGTVENAGWTFYSGRRVGIRDAQDRLWFYAHLSSIAPGITKGAAVAAGTVLGSLGSSGYGPEPAEDEFAPHLHFGLQNGSRWVNPEAMLRALYASTVKRIRAGRAELAAFDRRIGLLASRPYLPGAPDPVKLQLGLQDLRERRSAVEDSLTMTVSL